VPVNLRCELRIGRGSWHCGHLIDLSATGCRLSWTAGAAVGSDVWIRIAGLETLRAEIRWQKGDEIGCRFASPLSPYVFDHFARSHSRWNSR
jgi:hypothetical protein